MCLCLFVCIFVFVCFDLCIYVLCLDGPGNFLCQGYQDICHVGNLREFPMSAEIEADISFCLVMTTNCLYLHIIHIGERVEFQVVR